MSDGSKKGKVILDVDGVLNSFSNHNFYAQFIWKSLRGLSKVHGRMKLLKELPKLKKKGGANALFAFAKEFCGDDKKFNEFKHNLVNSLNFNLISHDPSMKKMMERLGEYGDICIRSDGLEEIGAAIWKRVIDDTSSAKIKLDMLNDKTDKKYKELKFGDKNIIISGIADNGFRLKTDTQSWVDFSDRHGIDIGKSVLLDDSRNNTNTANKLGMTTVHISVIDSFLQKSPLGTIYGHSLSDILGERMSNTLKSYQISYGNKVDVKTLFRTILSKKSKSVGENKGNTGTLKVSREL